MKQFFLAVLATCYLAQPSFADSQSGSAVSVKPLHQGFYAGLEFGMAEASAEGDYPLIAGGSSSADADLGTGRAFGAVVGYNHRNGPYVYGGELRLINLAYLIEKEDTRKETPEITAVIDLRGRFGYVNEDWLFYGALGWSRANYRIHPGEAYTSGNNTAILTGLNIGVGAEYSINARWLAGIDYTYRDLDGDFDDTGLSSDADLSTLTLRVAYQF